MKKLFLTAVLALMPAVASAQVDAATTNITALLNALKSWIDILIPVVIAAAVLFFFWGLARYILAEADDSKVAGRRMMLWGVITLFVMISIWGLTGFLQNLFGINPQQNPPTIPSVGGSGTQ
jgi:hypothetical protein